MALLCVPVVCLSNTNLRINNFAGGSERKWQKSNRAAFRDNKVSTFQVHTNYKLQILEERFFSTNVLYSGSEGSEQIQQSLRYNVHKNLAECYNNSGELLLAEDHFFQVTTDQPRTQECLLFLAFYCLMI